MFKAYVLAFVGPTRAYQIIGKAATNFTRSCVYESKSIDHNEVEIKVTAKPGVQEMPFQCENRIGYFEVVATLFNRTLQHIEHPECMFRGGHCCRYVLTGRTKHLLFWERSETIFFPTHDTHLYYPLFLVIPISTYRYYHFTRPRYRADAVHLRNTRRTYAELSTI